MIINLEKSSYKAGQKIENHYTAQDCGLVVFPILEMHRLSGLRHVTLSGNRIANLESLTNHASTHRHCLRHLKSVDLSRNLLTQVQSLRPLADSALNLAELNICGNPLTQSLNFCLDLLLLFGNALLIWWAQTEKPLEVSEQTRKKAIQHHFLGQKVASFLQQLLLWSQAQPLQIALIEDILKDWQVPVVVDALNDTILKGLQQFGSVMRGGRNQNTLSPVVAEQFDYRIFSPESRGKQVADMYVFYLGHMLGQPCIQQKLLDELQVSEQTNKLLQTGSKVSLDAWHFEQAAQSLWQQQKTLIHQHQQTNGIYKQKSINQQMQTHPSTERLTQSLEENADNWLYFGCDQDWSQLTLAFLKHHLLSALKHTTSDSKRSLPIEAPLTSPRHPVITSSFECQLLSPKSQNKFIVSSCLAVLAQTVVRIAFRKLRRGRNLKLTHFLTLDKALSDIRMRMVAASYRRILQEAFLMQCIQHRLDALVLKRLFKAWRQVRKRRLKLLRNLLTRKGKKERAFAGVILTQWRLTARHIAIASKIKQQQLALGLQPQSTARVTSRPRSRKSIVQFVKGKKRCLN